ncbi:hypothetical protein [Pajaroellobacter abortibovis]|uniref:hypothetical protein n=1 Tax=Pajaroellobacter abortibovis TaxID=1882918 RepID=UPI001C12A503|nr:hypothetical protein [Pajaroellobacter abortibovis]
MQQGRSQHGLGDPSYDLDLFMVTDKQCFLSRKDQFASKRKQQKKRLHFRITYLHVGGVEFGVEVHEMSTFRSLFSVLNQLDTRDEDHVLKSFRDLAHLDRQTALDMLHRLRISVHLANRDAYHAMRMQLDEKRFLHWYARIHLVNAGDYSKETRHSFHQEDKENFYLKLCMLFNSLADALLSLSGGSLDRWK